MFHEKRGRAVIINNKNFVNLPIRKGCENDVKVLEKLFVDLHFEVILHPNKTAKVMYLFKVLGL